MTESNIKLWIMTDQDNAFCPISVEVILNDEHSTSYRLSLPDGAFHNINEEYNNNDKEYIAKKASAR